MTSESTADRVVGKSVIVIGSLMMLGAALMTPTHGIADGSLGALLGFVVGLIGFRIRAGEVA